MPALTRIEIEHYRGFYAPQGIDFAVPNGAPGSGLTVLVGPNNSGKTTVVDALKLTASGVGVAVEMEHRHDSLPFRITLRNSEGLSKTATNPSLGAVVVFETSADIYPISSHLRLVPSRRAWSAYTGNTLSDSLSYWNNAFHQDRVSPDSSLVARLVHLETDPKRKQYDELLKEVAPQVSKWRIDRSRGQNFVQYSTITGARHSADLLGDGIASLFRVSLAIFDSQRDNIIVIDEPELSLHPQAQKALARVLSRTSSDRQVIVTTHSPYFVNWTDLSNGANVCRLTQATDGVHVGHLSPQTLTLLRGSLNDWQKPNLLDAVAKEIFFADGGVFVEGQEDVGLLRKFAYDHNREPPEIFGYGAGGAGNIVYFLQMASDLGIPACAIYDGDHGAAEEEAKRRFPKALIEILPTSDIRDKRGRDQSGRETDQIVKAGLFDRHGVIKPECASYVLDLLDRVQTFLSERRDPRREKIIACASDTQRS
jgi:predicted ATP-dependent endonuclease of OLD family